MHNMVGLMVARFEALPAKKILRFAFAAMIVIMLLAHRTFLTPDILFFMLFVIILSFGMANQFMKMFVPFVGLLISYNALRNFIPYVTERVHFHEMINYDLIIGGGTLPTIWLQQLLYHGQLAWYDFYFYGLYMLHFIVPLILGVLIWRRRPQAYWQYAWSFIMLSYAAFVTYVLFPAAPPWMASEMDMIAPIQRISTDIWAALGIQSFPTVYAQLSPNLVAAVPSLHAAYPTLVALFVGKLFGWRWGALAFIYPVSIWVGIVYMGEHYVFDVLAGVGYALIAFLVIPQVSGLWRQLRARRTPAPKLKASEPHK